MATLGHLLSNLNYLKENFGTIEEILKEKSHPNEILAKFLKFLVSLSEKDQDENPDNCEKKKQDNLEIFFKIVEENFQNVLNNFKGSRIKVSGAIIKLLQISFGMMQVLEGNNEKHAFGEKLIFLIEKIMKYNSFEKDWKILRKIYEWKLCVNKDTKIDVDKAVFNICEKLSGIKKIFMWREETFCLQKIREIAENLLKMAKEEKEIFFECLCKGRFDKEIFKAKNINISNTIIVGDDGGLYYLINSKASEDDKRLLAEKLPSYLLDAGPFSLQTSEKSLNSKALGQKLVLGQGDYGKLRVALNVLKTEKVEWGQFVLIKKSKSQDKNSKSFNVSQVFCNIIDEYLAVNCFETVYYPRCLDSAVNLSENVEANHRKIYFIIDRINVYSGMQVFTSIEFKSYQKWEYQQPYIISLIDSMILLMENKLFYCDLKPENTIYNFQTLKGEIESLGPCFNFKSNKEKFDLSTLDLVCSKQYCPPEFVDEKEKKNVNVEYAMSYLCGKTFYDVTINTDLDEREKKKLLDVFNKLIRKKSTERADLIYAREKILEIGSIDHTKNLVIKSYIQGIRRFIKIDHSSIGLEKELDSNLENSIAQHVTEYNPLMYKGRHIEKIETVFEKFFNDKSDGIFVLLGEPGSGKSFALNVQFLKEIKSWKQGMALPLFLNMGSEIDLLRTVDNTNNLLGTKLSLNKDIKEVHLFVDGFDQGANISDLINDFSIIGGYLKQLKVCDLKKFIVSCRSDFLRDSRSDVFNIKGLNTVFMYMVPLNYQKKKVQSPLGILGEKWLERVNADLKKEIERMIELHEIKSKINTYCIFKYVLNILCFHLEEIKKEPLFTFAKSEIYKIITSAQLKQNVQLLSQNETKFKMLSKFVFNRKINDTKSKKKIESDNELIISELEELVEFIAITLHKEKKFRINSYELLNKYLKLEKELDDQVGYEENEVFQLCRLLPLKFERFCETNFNEELKIGFCQETLKNYFLFRALLRAVKNQTGSERDKMIEDILDDKSIILNLEFITICAQETKTDPEFKKNLIRILKEEKDKVLKRGRAAVIVSILVSGNHSFSQDDLSGLDLSFSNLRGGVFHGVDFSKTNLSFSSLKSAWIKNSKFTNSDIRGIKTGLYPNFNKEKINTLAWSNDELKLATVSSDQIFSFKVWNITTGLCISTVKAHNQYIKCLSWSFNNDFIASGSEDHLIKIWDSANGKCQGVLSGHQEGVWCIDWRNDNKTLVSGARDYLIKIWDTNKGTCLRTLSYKGHNDWVSCLKLSPNGKYIATGSWDKTLKLWDFNVGACMRTFTGSLDNVLDLCWANSSEFIASVAGAIVYIWNIKKEEVYRTLTGHHNTVTCVSWSFNGEFLASGSDDKTVKIWDAVNATQIDSVYEESGIVMNLRWSESSSNLAYFSKDASLKYWEAENEDLIHHTVRDEGLIKTAAWSRDDRRVVGCGDSGRIKIWDSETGLCLISSKEVENDVFNLAWSLDGNRIASSRQDGKIQIWDSQSAECIQTINGHSDWAITVAWSADNRRIASGGRDKCLKIWDSVTGTCLKIINGVVDIIWSICWSNDESKIAGALGGSDKTIRIFDLDGNNFKILTGHENEVLTVAWCPDVHGRRLASGSKDHAIKIWDYFTGACLKTLYEHKGPIWSVSWSNCGKWLATGSSDSSVKIWDCSMYSCLTTIKGHNGGVWSVSWSSDSNKILTGSWDNTLKIWENTENSSWILNRRLQAFNETFKCERSSFVNCKIDPESTNDVILKTVLQQEEGIWQGIYKILKCGFVYQF